MIKMIKKVLNMISHSLFMSLTNKSESGLAAGLLIFEIEMKTFQEKELSLDWSQQLVAPQYHLRENDKKLRELLRPHCHTL